MEKKVLSDGAFERFLSSALATILTIIFSWRFLLEADQLAIAPPRREPRMEEKAKAKERVEQEEEEEDASPGEHGVESNRHPGEECERAGDTSEQRADDTPRAAMEYGRYGNGTSSRDEAEEGLDGNKATPGVISLDGGCIAESAGSYATGRASAVPSVDTDAPSSLIINTACPVGHTCHGVNGDEAAELDLIHAAEGYRSTPPNHAADEACSGITPGHGDVDDDDSENEFQKHDRSVDIEPACSRGSPHTASAVDTPGDSESCTRSTVDSAAVNNPNTTTGTTTVYLKPTGSRLLQSPHARYQFRTSGYNAHDVTSLLKITASDSDEEAYPETENNSEYDADFSPPRSEILAGNVNTSFSTGNVTSGVGSCHLEFINSNIGIASSQLGLRQSHGTSGGDNEQFSTGNNISTWGGDTTRFGDNMSQEVVADKPPEQYLVRELSFESSSECDSEDAFNRPLDTITEEDTSDLESSGPENRALVNRLDLQLKAKRESPRHDDQSSSDDEDTEVQQTTPKRSQMVIHLAQRDSRSLSRGSSFGSSDGETHSVMSSDIASETGSIDVGGMDANVDPSAGDSPATEGGAIYTPLQTPRRVINIGPYVDRDFAAARAANVTADSEGDTVQILPDSASGDSSAALEDTSVKYFLAAPSSTKKPSPPPSTPASPLPSPSPSCSPPPSPSASPLPSPLPSHLASTSPLPSPLPSPRASTSPPPLPLPSQSRTDNNTCEFPATTDCQVEFDNPFTHDMPPRSSDQDEDTGKTHGPFVKPRQPMNKNRLKVFAPLSVSSDTDKPEGVIWNAEDSDEDKTPIVENPIFPSHQWGLTVGADSPAHDSNSDSDKTPVVEEITALDHMDHMDHMEVSEGMTQGEADKSDASAGENSDRPRPYIRQRKANESVSRLQRLSSSTKVQSSGTRSEANTDATGDYITPWSPSSSSGGTSPTRPRGLNVYVPDYDQFGGSRHRLQSAGGDTSRYVGKYNDTTARGTSPSAPERTSWRDLSIGDHSRTYAHSLGAHSQHQPLYSTGVYPSAHYSDRPYVHSAAFFSASRQPEAACIINSSSTHERCVDGGDPNQIARLAAPANSSSVERDTGANLNSAVRWQHPGASAHQVGAGEKEEEEEEEWRGKPGFVESLAGLDTCHSPPSETSSDLNYETATESGGENDRYTPSTRGRPISIAPGEEIAASEISHRDRLPASSDRSKFTFELQEHELLNANRGHDFSSPGQGNNAAHDLDLRSNKTTTSTDPATTEGTAADERTSNAIAPHPISQLRTFRTVQTYQFARKSVTVPNKGVGTPEGEDTATVDDAHNSQYGDVDGSPGGGYRSRNMINGDSANNVSGAVGEVQTGVAGKRDVLGDSAYEGTNRAYHNRPTDIYSDDLPHTSLTTNQGTDCYSPGADSRTPVGETRQNVGVKDASQAVSVTVASSDPVVLPGQRKPRRSRAQLNTSCDTSEVVPFTGRADPCTAYATSTALARRDLDLSKGGLNRPQDVAESVVSAVASAEASGADPYIAIARASARAATVATASAARSVAVDCPAGASVPQRDISVVISTSCSVKGDDEEVINQASEAIQAMAEGVHVSVQRRPALTDASTQSSVELKEPDLAKRHLRIVIDHPDGPDEQRTIECELPHGSNDADVQKMVSETVKQILHDNMDQLPVGLRKGHILGPAVERVTKQVVDAYTQISPHVDRRQAGPLRTSRSSIGQPSRPTHLPHSPGRKSAAINDDGLKSQGSGPQALGNNCFYIQGADASADGSSAPTDKLVLKVVTDKSHQAVIETVDTATGWKSDATRALPPSRAPQVPPSRPSVHSRAIGSQSSPTNYNHAGYLTRDNHAKQTNQCMSNDGRGQSISCVESGVSRGGHGPANTDAGLEYAANLPNISTTESRTYSDKPRSSRGGGGDSVNKPLQLNQSNITARPETPEETTTEAAANQSHVNKQSKSYSRKQAMDTQTARVAPTIHGDPSERTQLSERPSMDHIGAEAEKDATKITKKKKKKKGILKKDLDTNTDPPKMAPAAVEDSVASVGDVPADLPGNMTYLPTEGNHVLSIDLAQRSPSADTSPSIVKPKKKKVKSILKKQSPESAAARNSKQDSSVQLEAVDSSSKGIYNSVLQAPVQDSRTPIHVLNSLEPAEKETPESRRRINSARQGYLERDERRSGDKSPIDIEFELHEQKHDGEIKKKATARPKSKTKNFFMVDIDFEGSQSKEDSSARRNRTEQLKQQLLRARPKPPPASYVDKVWNAGAILASRSHEMGLNKLREFHSTADRHYSESGTSTPNSESYFVRMSKSTASLPRDFFTDKRSYTSLMETDLDTGITEETPLIHETHLDDKDTPQRSKSLTNLQTGEWGPGLSVYRSPDRELNDHGEEQQSGAVTNSAVTSSPPDEKTQSAHALRVTRSLNQLSIPDWFKSSPRQNQEIVLMENARPRAIKHPRPPLKNSPKEGEDGLDTSRARPVVIQHRVTYPSRFKSADRLSPQPTFDDQPVELPSEKLKQKSPQLSLQPVLLKSFEEMVGGTLRSDSPPQRPAKEAYLRLKDKKLEENLSGYRNSPSSKTEQNQEGDVWDKSTGHMGEDFRLQENFRQEPQVNKESIYGDQSLSSHPNEGPPQYRATDHPQIMANPVGRPSEGIIRSQTHRVDKAQRGSAVSAPAQEVVVQIPAYQDLPQTTGPNSQLSPPNGAVANRELGPPPPALTTGLKKRRRRRKDVTQQPTPAEGNARDPSQEGITRATPPPRPHQAVATDGQTRIDLPPDRQWIDERPAPTAAVTTTYFIGEKPENFHQRSNSQLTEDQPQIQGIQRRGDDTGNSARTQIESLPVGQINGTVTWAENHTDGHGELTEYAQSPGSSRRSRRRGKPAVASPTTPETMHDAPPYRETVSINLNSFQNNNTSEKQRKRISSSLEDMLDGLLVLSSPEESLLAGSSPAPVKESPLERAFRLLDYTQSSNGGGAPDDTGSEGLGTTGGSASISSSAHASPKLTVASDEPLSLGPGENEVIVKCRRQKCRKAVTLSEARSSYKTCHNCYTYYCSRECRKAHWERHKAKCLYSRVGSACKHVIKSIHDDERIANEMARVARTGYLARGRGCLLVVFSSPGEAEDFASRGLEALQAPPAYASVGDLEGSDVLGEHMFEVVDMCRTYNPEIKFVANVAIVTGEEIPVKAAVGMQTGPVIQKCAKLRLKASQSPTPPSKSRCRSDRDTLILTAVPGAEFTENMPEKKARQICFVNIQRQLRERGISLRHHFPEVYTKLCSYVADNEHFTPITIFPVDGNTGLSFMCLIMPDSDPDLEWLHNSQDDPGQNTSV